MDTAWVGRGTIPDEYIHNNADPFKPFFKYNSYFGIGRVYDYATILLYSFTIAEVKEIRSFLAKAVLEYAQCNVNIIRAQYDNTYTFKDYAKYRSLLIGFLNGNDENKIYQTSTNKQVNIIHLYSVMSIKFIKQAIKILNHKRYGDFDSIVHTPKYKLSMIDYSNISQSLIFATESLYTGQLIYSNSYNEQLKQQRLDNFKIRIDRIEETKKIAISKAQTYWNNDDPYKIIRSNTMTEIILADLKLLAHSSDEIFVPTKETLKEWIKPIAPDYAKQNGRPSEREKEQSKVFVKERFDIDI